MRGDLANRPWCSTNPQATVLSVEDRCAHRLVRLSARPSPDKSRVCHHGAIHRRANLFIFLFGAKTSRQIVGQSFPIVEKYGFMWIFPGDPQLAPRCRADGDERMGRLN